MKHFKEAELNRVYQAQDLVKQFIREIKEESFLVDDNEILEKFNNKINDLQNQIVELEEKELETKADDEAEKQRDTIEELED